MLYTIIFSAKYAYFPSFLSLKLTIKQNTCGMQAKHGFNYFVFYFMYLDFFDNYRLSCNLE